MGSTTTRFPDRLCHVCGYQVSAADSLWPGRRPKAGDFGLCMNCSAIHVFLPGLDWRPAILSDLANLDPEERDELLQTKAALQAAREAGIIGDLNRDGGHA